MSNLLSKIVLTVGSAPAQSKTVDPSVFGKDVPVELPKGTQPLAVSDGDAGAVSGPTFFQGITDIANHLIAGFMALKLWQQITIVCLILAAVVLLVWFCYKMVQKNKQEKLAGTKGAQGQAGNAEAMAQGEGSDSMDAFHRTAQSEALPRCPILLGKVHGIGDRKDQQDSFAVSDVKDAGLYLEKGFLAVVADGMGGLANGGMVSAAVVRTCVEMFYDRKGEEPAARSLLKMATEVNRRVNRLLAGQRERSGSTMVTAIVSQGMLYFLTVGDSRIYLYRQGRLICLNRPHIYAEELALRAVNGIDSLDSVERDVQKDALTSYIGAGTIKHLDRNTEGIQLVRGDKIMLASDGVFGTLSTAGMEQMLKEAPAKAAALMDEAVQAAEKLRQDNYTAVILEYMG